MTTENDRLDKDLVVSKKGGKKYSKGKPRMGLVPMQPLVGVAEVMTHGAEKYSVNNWKKNPISVYVDAWLRHVAAYMEGETIDKDSGLRIIDHINCNGFFIAQLEREGKKFNIEEK